jgi:hypothetical protein
VDSADKEAREASREEEAVGSSDSGVVAKGEADFSAFK